MNKDYKNSSILLLQTAFIGDVILTIPIIRSTKLTFPHSTITLLTTPQGKELLEGIKEIDEFIIYDKRGKDRGISAFKAMVKKIRMLSFDLSLSPHRSYRSASLQYLAGIPMRIGFSDASFSFLYHRRVKREPAMHEIDRNLELLKGPGFEHTTFSRDISIPIDYNMNERADDILKRFGLSGTERLFGVCPGSVWATKRWQPDGFAGVINALTAELGAKVILLGSKEDKNVANEVSSRCVDGVVNLVGETSLTELVGLIARCGLFISNDTGPMHIAAALGIPQVAIFGPTTPDLGFGPYNSRARVVEKEIDCRPCSPHGPRKCPERHFRCMKEIGSEDVIKAAMEVLGLKIED